MFLDCGTSLLKTSRFSTVSREKAGTMLANVLVFGLSGYM